MIVFDLTRFRPVQNSFNFRGIHFETIFQEKESQIFDGISGKLAFVRTAVKAMLPELTKNFPYMCFVLGRVVGKNKDVVQIDNNIDVQKVTENVIHKMLKSSQGISESKWYNTPFKRTITGTESRLPFITFGNTD